MKKSSIVTVLVLTIATALLAWNPAAFFYYTARVFLGGVVVYGVVFVAFVMNFAIARAMGEKSWFDKFL